MHTIVCSYDARVKYVLWLGEKKKTEKNPIHRETPWVPAWNSNS